MFLKIFQHIEKTQKKHGKHRNALTSAGGKIYDLKNHIFDDRKKFKISTVQAIHQVGVANMSNKSKK